MNLNKAFLIGRLTNDPQLRSLPSGQSICSFGIATNRYFVDKTGQKQEKTEFHNIVLFGKLAEIASKYLKKGGLVFVEGRIQSRTWQDSSGNQKTRVEIIGERIQLGPRSAPKPEEEKETPEELTSEEEIPVVEEDEIDVSQIPF